MARMKRKRGNKRGRGHVHVRGMERLVVSECGEGGDGEDEDALIVGRHIELTHVMIPSRARTQTHISFHEQ